ncbi:hypothetical protein GCM10022408_02660 [Hymenobacter fastidiosus]|uniref:DUF998 domain-containing protein n=1 Tax=Hymenobacter fastidiosus TaxID=486264 RepID=A0ABP7RCA2_9BACT
MPTILLASLVAYLVAGILYFGARRGGYSHRRDTISELGEDGAPDRQRVSWGLFFPVGLGLVLLGGLLTGAPALGGLLLCLGTGYLIAAVFPCDVGSPATGSAKQTLHNFGGFVEYAGGIFFLNQAQDQLLLRTSIPPAGQCGLLFGCLVLMSVPDFRFRGLAQRLAEGLLFGQALWLSSRLW